MITLCQSSALPASAPGRFLPSALACCIAGIAVAAAPQEVRLDYDLDAGRVRIAAAAETLEVTLPADSLAAAWQTQVAAFARGEWNSGIASRWGKLLLPAACAPLLQGATRWRIADAQLAGLDALLAPWDPSVPIVERVELVFGESETVRARGEGALMLQPFHVLDLDRDDPDTLQAAFKLQLRTVDHLPRNDVEPALLRGLFVAPGYELLSLRAVLPLPAGWSTEWSNAPPLRVWTWPALAAGPEEGTWCAELLSLARGAVVLADRWPLPEAARAGDLAAVLLRMQAGESLGVAFHTVRRELSRRGAPPARWAGWVLVGDAEYRLQSAEPMPWVAWFRKLRARGLGLKPPG